MIIFLEILNFFILLLFGIVLSIAFSGVERNNKNSLSMLLLFSFISCMQVASYATVGMEMTTKIYPLISHFPIVLFLRFYHKKSWLVACISISTAYLCCQPNRWLSSLVLFFTQKNELIYYAVQIFLMLLLLFFLLKYVSPIVAQQINTSRKFLLHFGIVPIAYYLFHYTTTVYTDLLYTGSRVAVEFMPSFMTIFYFAFLILYFKETEKRNEFESNYKLLNIQVTQSIKELESLHQFQQQAAIYRHDLRHHLQYISACINDQNPQDALDYIETINTHIENQKLVIYCKNYSINLILSSYITKAENLHIAVHTNISIPAEIKIPASDLCVILANGLENAIHACEKLRKKEKRLIRIIGYQEKSKIFLQIENFFDGQVSFKDGFPIAKEDEDEHGIGTKSIVAAVEKHKGIYSFEANNGMFILRVSI